MTNDTTGTVTPLRIVEVGDGFRIDVEAVLAGAGDAGLTDVIVLGREPDGAIYIASSCTEAQTIQLIEQAKFVMMFDAMAAK